MYNFLQQGAAPWAAETNWPIKILFIYIDSSQVFKQQLFVNAGAGITCCSTAWLQKSWNYEWFLKSVKRTKIFSNHFWDVEKLKKYLAYL